jgi:hypothetical protein
MLMTGLRKRSPIGSSFVVLALGMLVWGIVPAAAQGVPGTTPNGCLAGKTKCVAAKVAGLLKCRTKCQKSPKGCGAAQAACEAKVIAKFDGGAQPAKGCFAKLEAKSNPAKPASVCTTVGDTASVEANVDALVCTAVAALENQPSCGGGPAPRLFPATGQLTCWNAAGQVVPCGGTGQDGDIRAGAALAYQDNGDGTITDLNTKLTWEKLSDDGSIHDKGDVYTWADAFAVKVAALNAGAGFANHTDWRLPNRRELESLVNLEGPVPTVSAPFDTGCVPGCALTACSCTAVDGYWSSTTYVATPTQAWRIGFFDGSVYAGNKVALTQVRAVRGGL